ncbi:hypothetical protein BS47DRAFT_1377781 [Hydnum rufescens UP504]|uniref:Nitric oxide synthase-interacting protein zinc-finger domain-containing protein n=1 Tax=Hydnum rufescens UP504 TaxID=1448309 RepID=A0A9P6AMI8_9AGAM|nr:hypothetical protein BS47DRAFT_1377781 [Hydnum rufescens UP504]
MESIETKHSRNNTASSVFTYAEYKKLDSHYGTKKQRLGAESMRPFDACSLCLQRAREPTACSRGHIYCKECIYADLLAQRKEIKRHQAKLEAMAREEEETKFRAREAARERVLADFEKEHLGLAAKKNSKTGEQEIGSASGTSTLGVKRKFAFDQDTIDKLALEAEEAALKQIEVEQAEARRAKLPDFWLPSLTPVALPGPLKDIKLQCLCHQSQPSHPISLKSLIPMTFTYEKPASSTPTSSSTPKVDQKTICPSCKKELSNSTNLSRSRFFHSCFCCSNIRYVKLVLIACSHVICRTCSDTLVRTSHQCAVCDKSAKDKEIIDMDREGTGFSAGGRAETSKVGVAFQG